MSKHFEATITVTLPDDVLESAALITNVGQAMKDFCDEHLEGRGVFSQRAFTKKPRRVKTNGAAHCEVNEAAEALYDQL